MPLLPCHHILADNHPSIVEGEVRVLIQSLELYVLQSCQTDRMCSGTDAWVALAAGVSSISGSKRSVKIEAGMQISLSGMYVIGGGTNYACANVTWSEARVPGSSGPAVSYVKRLSDWTGRQEVLGRPHPSLAGG